MPYVPLTPDQLAFLAEHCRLSVDTEAAFDEPSITSADLLHAHTVEDYIEGMSQSIDSPNHLVTASQFSKKFAFLMVAPFFASFSLFDRKLNVQPDNCVLIPKWKNEMLIPELYLKAAEAEPIGRDREKDMESALRNLFRDHVAVMWDRLAKHFNVPLPVLWENTAIYVYWLYETALLQHARGSKEKRVASDFAYILDAPAECFGWSENPIKKFNTEKQQLLKSDPPIRIRKTCCFYYEISPDRSFCKTCPRCLSGYVPKPKKVT